MSSTTSRGRESEAGKKAEAEAEAKAEKLMHTFPFYPRIIESEVMFEILKKAKEPKTGKDHTVKIPDDKVS